MLSKIQIEVSSSLQANGMDHREISRSWIPVTLAYEKRNCADPISIGTTAREMSGDKETRTFPALEYL
jgi:hypothetical protein